VDVHDLRECVVNQIRLLNEASDILVGMNRKTAGKELLEKKLQGESDRL